jgi:hypothetical protein
MFTPVTYQAICTPAQQLKAETAEGISPRGLAELSIRHLRHAFPEARNEIDLLTIQHGYWRVETAAKNLLEGYFACTEGHNNLSSS